MGNQAVSPHDLWKEESKQVEFCSFTQKQKTGIGGSRAMQTWELWLPKAFPRFDCESALGRWPSASPFSYFILHLIPDPDTSQNRFPVINGRWPSGLSSYKTNKKSSWVANSAFIELLVHTKHILLSLAIQGYKIPALLSESSQSVLSPSSHSSLHSKCQGLNYSQRIKWSILG